MSTIKYTNVFNYEGIITNELLERMSKVCCAHCGHKNICLNANVNLCKGKLEISHTDYAECSDCKGIDHEFVDDDVYLKNHKLICKEDYIHNKKHREDLRNKLSKDISSIQKELISNQELTFDEWYKETHHR